ncbi:hypothetical protein DPMN_191230 [Dreissena polymorpha]|uniref:Uncharacterized protein n=1 Tax=Dreissena polymorpha TaxID=45954 RepID=A0A9D3XY90_DREPO|nr:hypothetical protein DPMN_191230 [Dreissena polymorpha]
MWLSKDSTAASRTIPTQPGFYHRPDSSRINTAVVKFPKLPCWPPGFPTFQVIKGSTRSYTAAIWLTFRTFPDSIRVDPATTCDWDVTLTKENVKKRWLNKI